MTARWALVPLLLIAACSNDTSEPSLQDIDLDGRVVKGPVVDAAVSVHALASDAGLARRLGGPYETNAQGRFGGTLRASDGGPFVWESVGGSFVDEVSSEVVDLSDFAFHGYSPGGTVVLTPYSTALYHAAGATAELLGLSAHDAWRRVGDAFVTAFGIDPWTTVPDASGDPEQKQYAALLGGVSELLDSDPQLASLGQVETLEFLAALVEDLADGRLNGLNVRGELLFVEGALGPVLFPSLDAHGIAPLVAAANRYASSVPELSGISFEETTLEIDPTRTGTGGGSVTFSGEGAADLPVDEFLPNFFSQTFYALGWESILNGIRIEVVPSPTKPELALSVRVLANTDSWLAQDLFDVNGVSGVTIDGTTVRFVDVLVAGTVLTTTELQLDGRLTAEPELSFQR